MVSSESFPLGQIKVVRKCRDKDARNGKIAYMSPQAIFDCFFAKCERQPAAKLYDYQLLNAIIGEEKRNKVTKSTLAQKV